MASGATIGGTDRRHGSLRHGVDNACYRRRYFGRSFENLIRGLIKDFPPKLQRRRAKANRRDVSSSCHDRSASDTADCLGFVGLHGNFMSFHGAMVAEQDIQTVRLCLPGVRRREVPALVDHSGRSALDVAVAVVPLEVCRSVNYRVRAEEPAQERVINAAVHVNQA